MAAGLTLNAEDIKPYGTPAAKAAGYYPIEMIRCLVGVWLFAGLRIDEIRRLELDCVIWDQGHDEHTGETYQVCLLRVPVNKTSGPFTKPVERADRRPGQPHRRTIMKTLLRSGSEQEVQPK
jgi:hypothetical protein